MLRMFAASKAVDAVIWLMMASKPPHFSISARNAAIFSSCLSERLKVVPCGKRDVPMPSHRAQALHMVYTFAGEAVPSAAVPQWQAVG